LSSHVATGLVSKYSTNKQQYKYQYLYFVEMLALAYTVQGKVVVCSTFTNNSQKHPLIANTSSCFKHHQSCNYSVNFMAATTCYTSKKICVATVSIHYLCCQKIGHNQYFCAFRLLACYTCRLSTTAENFALGDNYFVTSTTASTGTEGSSSSTSTSTWKCTYVQLKYQYQ